MIFIILGILFLAVTSVLVYLFLNNKKLEEAINKLKVLKDEYIKIEKLGKTNIEKLRKELENEQKIIESSKKKLMEIESIRKEKDNIMKELEEIFPAPKSTLFSLMRRRPISEIEYFQKERRAKPLRSKIDQLNEKIEKEQPNMNKLQEEVDNGNKKINIIENKIKEETNNTNIKINEVVKQMKQIQEEIKKYS